MNDAGSILAGTYFYKVEKQKWRMSLKRCLANPIGLRVLQVVRFNQLSQKFTGHFVKCWFTMQPETWRSFCRDDNSIDFCTQNGRAERVRMRERLVRKVGRMWMRKFNKIMFLCAEELEQIRCIFAFAPHWRDVYTLYQIINKSNLYEDVTFLQVSRKAIID